MFPKGLNRSPQVELTPSLPGPQKVQLCWDPNFGKDGIPTAGKLTWLAGKPTIWVDVFPNKK